MRSAANRSAVDFPGSVCPAVDGLEICVTNVNGLLQSGLVDVSKGGKEFPACFASIVCIAPPMAIFVVGKRCLRRWAPELAATFSSPQSVPYHRSLCFFVIGLRAIPICRP